MRDMAAEYDLHHFTVAQYHRMVDSGTLRADARVELLDGLIVDMPRLGPRHGRLHAVIVQRLGRRLSDRTIAGQISIEIDEFNETEPDIAILCDPSDAQFAQLTTRVRVAEVLALIEIADSSLHIDLKAKRYIYARGGIPDYLVVDVNRNELVHFTNPDGADFTVERRHRHGDSFALTSLPEETLLAHDFLAPE